MHIAFGKTFSVLCFLGTLAATLFFHYQKLNDSLTDEIAQSLTEMVLISDAEQGIRRRALEHLHNLSAIRQDEIRREDEIIQKKMHSDEFYFLDHGMRFNIQHDWDYDYWLAENSSDYYDYYLTDSLHHTAIIGVAQNATLDKIKFFVGSLIRTGYIGRIVIAIDEKSDENTIHYLKSHRVDIKFLDRTTCTHSLAKTELTERSCIDPYPHIISEWSLIPVVRDYLLTCYQKKECIDAVLVVDVSKTFFQRDPFGPGARFIKKLELFEENPHVDVKTSIVRERILTCTGLDIRNRPMISPDSVAGPVLMVISFLDQVYDIMRTWMSDPNCFSHFHSYEDLKAIFNFIRLNNSAPVNVSYYSHRTGLINNVGYDGQRILQSHIHFQQFRGFSNKEAMTMPFEGSNGSRWIGSDYLLIDDEGFFVNLDFRRSFIVQQYDTFGPPFLSWLENNHNKSAPHLYDHLIKSIASPSDLSLQGNA